MPETFVVTKEIKAAVVGRETEVLDGLGIEWRKARPHIDCPYPAHGGKDDWRWDDKKKRAFCTCNKPGTSDTVFDVIAKCEGVDEFDHVKIRAAKLLGREDLIKTKSGGGQKQDAESLLHPPAEVRDDALPRSYLAFRLGAEPADVLMPSTPATGFRSLGYFDPPATQKGTPVHVGDFPCAIFGQADANGGRHAHRIYVAPAGQGKAVLGRRADGRERDPKKAARVAEGDNTSGRSVLWGDPAVSEHIVLCEGIETGAAIALAFRTDIAAGKCCVASAVTAGGVEAFCCYPATTSVTIAADRDEKVIPSKPTPSRRGEKAAREFGMRHHNAIVVKIAMPGQAATKTDWLNVMASSGAHAVRAGIMAAEPFIPTQEEIAAFQERAGTIDALARVATDFPLPTLFGTQLEYAIFDGAPWAHKAVSMGKGEERSTALIPVFTPFGVPARLKFADEKETYGLRVVVRDMAGAARTIDTEREGFAKVGAAEARSMLFAAGLRVLDDGEKIAVDLLKAAGPQREICIVRKPGWHDINGHPDPVFVCPDGTILGLPAGHALELAVGARLGAAVAQGGTLQGWKDAAAAAVGAVGCPHWTLGVMAAFAGPLIALTGLDSCGINISGLSSSGKSTAQKLAASAWSKAASNKDTLFQSAKATVNSIEQMAARSNGSVLVLDELAHVSGKELGKIIYTIAGNTGKRRMSAAATLKESYSWATFAVLSAETSLEEKIRKDDGEWTAGQTVRMPDIDVTGIDRAVSADTLGRIDGIKGNFGHAGPAFVQAMIDAGLHREPGILRENINTLAVKIATAGMGKADSAVTRAANVFAILTMAGALAKDFGLLPAGTRVNDVVRWAWERFRNSSDAVALDPEQQAIANIRTWIAERWAVSIHNIDADARPAREAAGWFDKDAVYLPDKRLMEASGGTLKEAEVAKALKATGCLLKGKSDKHLFREYVPKIGKVKVYALSRDHFGHGSDRASLKVVGGRE